MKEVKLGGGIQLYESGVKVKFKRTTSEAVTPFHSKPGDAGLDLVATSELETALYTEYGTGLKVAIPLGYVGLLFPRSSCSLKTQVLANCVGVIDSNYRGEIKLRFKNTEEGLKQNSYLVGDKVGQLLIMPLPQVELLEVDELDETVRGEQGFGSSGK